jgi:hypothetical protein
MLKCFLFLILFPIIHSEAFSQNRSYSNYYQLMAEFDFELELFERVTTGIDFNHYRQSVDQKGFKLYKHAQRYAVQSWFLYRLSDQFDLHLSPIGYYYELPLTRNRDELDEWTEELRFAFRVRFAPEDLAFSHRLGVESIFVRDYEDDRYNQHRIRYRLRLNTPIFGNFRLIAHDELYFNIASNRNMNFFDQNAFLVGIRKEIGDLQITVGYKNELDLESIGRDVDLIHAIYINFSLRSSLKD